MLIIILGMLAAFALFFYFNNQRIRRMEEHHERSKQKFERLLHTLQKKGKDAEQGDDKSDKTEPSKS